MHKQHCMHRRYRRAMTAITIRDVPEHVLTSVKVHAAQAGQSLQTYVLDLLAHDAEKTAPLSRQESEIISPGSA